MVPIHGDEWPETKMEAKNFDILAKNQKVQFLLYKAPFKQKEGAYFAELIKKFNIFSYSVSVDLFTAMVSSAPSKSEKIKIPDTLLENMV